MWKTQKIQQALAMALCVMYVLVMVFSTLFHNHAHGTFASALGLEKGDQIHSIKTVDASSDCNACHFLSHQISFESCELWTTKLKVNTSGAQIFYFEAPVYSTTLFHSPSRGPPSLSI